MYVMLVYGCEIRKIDFGPFVKNRGWLGMGSEKLDPKKQKVYAFHPQICSTSLTCSQRGDFKE